MGTDPTQFRNVGFIAVRIYCPLSVSVRSPPAAPPRNYTPTHLTRRSTIDVRLNRKRVFNFFRRSLPPPPDGFPISRRRPATRQ